MAVASHAALVGTSDAIEPHASLDELAELFDLGKISTAPARFDVEELKALNAKLLHKLPYEAVAERLEALGIGGGAAFWDAVRGNLAVLAMRPTGGRSLPARSSPSSRTPISRARAAALLPPEPWDDTTWDVWTRPSRRTGLKGRALFHPLRLALTGLEAGPELKALLPLIGRAKVEAAPWPQGLIARAVASVRRLQPGEVRLAHVGHRYLMAQAAAPRRLRARADSPGPRKSRWR